MEHAQPMPGESARAVSNQGGDHSTPRASKRLYRILDIWGVARSKAFLGIVLVVTAVLVLLEAKYNINLLSTISDPEASKDMVGDLTQRGKLLAAFGITWAVARSLLTSIRPFLLGLSLFAALSVGTYHGLDYIYTKAISDLAPEIKVKGFGLFSYRHDLLTENLVDPDIPLPKDDPVIGKIFMGAFPIVLLDDRFMLPVQDTIEVKADYKGKAVLEQADKEWPQYAAQMRELQRAHDKFVSESKKALDTSRAENDWQRYNAQMQNLRDGHQRYIDGSRKAARYGSRGERSFREQSGGLSPDSYLSLPGFLRMLRSANHPEGDALRREEARELGQRASGKRVFGRDMPYFMGRNEFMRWVTELTSESFKAKGLKPNPNITRDQFVEMIRASDTKDGKNIRDMDDRIIGHRPDGTEIRLRELPYFLDHDGYLKWFSGQAEEAKRSALPTVDNVESFSNIHDVNSAVFLPPMAIISSLLSALTNALTFGIVLLGLGLSFVPATRWAGRRIVRFSVPIMIALFAGLLYLMPTHVFNSGTPLYELETQLHETVGVAGQLWSKLSNLQKLILKE